MGSHLTNAANPSNHCGPPLGKQGNARLHPHSHCPTTTKGSNNDVDKSKIALTNAVSTMATVEDDTQPGTLSYQTLKTVQTDEAT